MGENTQNYMLITENNRTEDNHYFLNPGGKHVHVFEIKPDTILDISLIHTHPFYLSQDNSILCWFSKEPFDVSLFYRPPLDRIFLKRQQIDYFFNQELTNVVDNCRLSKYNTNSIRFDTSVLPVGKYYMNVENLQNAENSYDCGFLYI